MERSSPERVEATAEAPVSGGAFAAAMRPFAIADDAHLAVAVSGGPDSMALLRLLAPWAQPRRIRLTALTVDHCLRSGSAAEAAQVGAWCAELGLAHVILPWLDAPAQTGKGRSLQTAARDARYGLLFDWCRRQAASALCLAHHADDQVETFLMRLARGSGIEGLAAMAPSSHRDGVRLLRPLLDFPKADLVATCAALGQGWCADPSNENTSATRVRFRKARAFLSAEGLTHDRLLQTVSTMRRAAEALRCAVDDLLQRSCRWEPTGLAQLQWQELAAAPQEIALRALARVLVIAGGAEYPPRFHSLQRLYAALTTGPWRDATLGGCRVRRDGHAIVIAREAAAISETLTLAPGEAGVWDRRFHITVIPDAPTPIRVMAAGRWATAERTPRIALVARASLPLIADDYGPLCLPHAPETLRADAEDQWKHKIMCRFSPLEDVAELPPFERM